VQAISVVCPHAGCFVNFAPEQNHYLCPCHNSTFATDGTIQDSKSPSPRALDTLETRVNEDGSVWVKYQSFRPGTPEKIAVS
jgi:Rieske Fe-S protein